MSQLEIDFKFLNKINLNKSAFGFADIIDLVDQDCDSFVSDELLLEIGGIKEDGEIDENQLRQNIKKTFLLISQEDQKSSSYNETEILQLTMIFFSFVTLII